MPSTPSPSLRLELQAAGENLNTWGAPKLNLALTDIDFAIAGTTSKALTADYALTSANYSADEARASTLVFTGTGAFTVTIPSVPKSYIVFNNCTGIVTLTTGAGVTAQVRAGESVWVRCDGANIYRVVPFYFSSMRLQALADPTGAQDAATKAYVDATAWSYNAGALPGQAGNAFKFVTTNGTTASWQQLTSADLSDTAARDAADLGRAVAFAVAL